VGHVLWMIMNSLALSDWELWCCRDVMSRGEEREKDATELAPVDVPSEGTGPADDTVAGEGVEEPTPEEEVPPEVTIWPQPSLRLYIMYSMLTFCHLYSLRQHPLLSMRRD